MDGITLNLKLISAKGLKKKDVYAVASIRGTTRKVQAQRTCTHKNGDSEPTWNFPMKFIINEADALQNRVTLVVKIKREGFFGGKNVGEVSVPVKELLDNVKSRGKGMQNVSYQVIQSSGKPKGVLCFTYDFGEGEEVTSKPVTMHPHEVAVGSNAGYPPSFMTAGGCYLSTPPRAYDTFPPQPLRSSMKFGLLGGGVLNGALLEY